MPRPALAPRPGRRGHARRSSPPACVSFNLPSSSTPGVSDLYGFAASAARALGLQSDVVALDLAIQIVSLARGLATYPVILPSAPWVRRDGHFLAVIGGRSRSRPAAGQALGVDGRQADQGGGT